MKSTILEMVDLSNTASVEEVLRKTYTHTQSGNKK